MTDVRPTTLPTVVSKSEYLDNLNRMLGDGSTLHHGHMPEIAVRGPGEAEGIRPVFDYLDIDQSDVDTYPLSDAP